MTTTYKLALMNSEILPLEDATVSILDRGFTLGDGVFETISFYGGKIYRVDKHRQRLNKSLAALQINIDVEKVFTDIQRLIKSNEAGNGIARLTVTRGEGGSGYLPPDNQIPNITVSLRQFSGNIPSSIKLEVSDIRKIPLQCLPANMKLCNGLNSVLAKNQAHLVGYYDALMLDINSHVSETSSANIFWVKNGRLYTPALSTCALEGIIRAVIMDYMPVTEVAVGVGEIMTADELFITSVGIKVLPVSVIRFGDKEFCFTGGDITAEAMGIIEKDIINHCAI